MIFTFQSFILMNNKYKCSYLRCTGIIYSNNIAINKWHTYKHNNYSENITMDIK